MDWTQILGDRNKYPDDAKLTINGTEVTLGQIRTQNAQQGGEIERRLTQRQAELDQTARQQQQATDNLASIVDNVQRVTGLSVEDIIAGRIPQHLAGRAVAAAGATPNAQGVPLSEDPLYKPVFDHFAPLTADVSNVKQVLGVALNTYKNDRARLDYMEYMQFKRPNEDFKVPFEEAVNLAVTKGYKNAEGWPDVTRAMDDLAAPVRAKVVEGDVRKQAFEEGRRAALAEQASSFGQPTLGGSAAGMDFSSSPDNKGERTKTIREQLDAAFKDPSILAGTTGATATVQ